MEFETVILYTENSVFTMINGHDDGKIEEMSNRNPFSDELNDWVVLSKYKFKLVLSLT